MTESQPFWKTKSLSQMSDSEWESLCDGCGKCCLYKLEDSDTGRVHHTNVACHLLDLNSCRCADYQNRHRLVSDCIKLDVSNVRTLDWLPQSCAYRLLAGGHDLPDWHPLLTGTSESVHRAGISVRNWAVSELGVEDLEAHLLDIEL